MKGFGILLALASAAILLICGPPALASGQYQNNLTCIASIDGNSVADAGPFVIAETPGVSSAVAQVVHDPGSCGGQLEAGIISSQNFVPITRRGAEFQRWRCRLLLRSSCC